MVIGFGILCLFYFLVLFVKRVDFAVIWLLAAVFFLVIGGYMAYRACHPEGFRLPAVFAAAVGIILAIGLAVFAVVESNIIKAMFTKPEPDLEYVIVLGAQVKGEVPSKALRKRLQAAEKYLRENPQTKAVLSGGKGDGEDISEAECMYRYLSAAGIGDERLLLEDRSTTTMENLRFSAGVIDGDQKNSVSEDAGTKEKSPAMESRVGLLSNNFHVYRAMLLGKKMGYRDLYGIAAGSDYKLQIHYMVREFFALVKEKMMGNI